MTTKKVKLAHLKLVGITARTNNKNEMNPEKAKIGETAGRYWGNALATNIQNRINPGVTYAVYTDYASDEHGDYTYFIGEAVSSFETQDTQIFTPLAIPDSQYQQFTTEQGTMPGIIIKAWQQIWQIKPGAFLGKRKYIADFEIYDEKASDPNAAVVDIFIGIE